MIESFLQKKLAEVLDEFIEFQKNKLISMQGLTLTKSKIKPKLVEYLSQILCFPLQLSQGFINQVTLNTPWQKLFLMKQSSIKLTIQGLRLITKLKNKFNYNYVSKSRDGIIQWMTDKLTGEASQNSTSSLVKKIKEYFFDTLQLEIKDIYLEIQVDLSHKVQIILKCDKIVFRKEEKTNIMKLNAYSIGLSYKTPTTKQQNLLTPTNISFIRQKRSTNGQIVSQKTLNIQKVHLNINNYNFNDIRRVISLISWHNSFMNLPCTLWKYKPLSLTKIRPYQKLEYYGKLIKQNIYDKNMKKILAQRRKYIQLYNQILKGNKDIKIKLNLKQLQDSMYIWKVLAYRNFCINKFKKNKEDLNKKQITQPQLFKSLPNQLIPSKDKQEENKQNQKQNKHKKIQNKLNGFSWMKSWFKSESNQQELIQQLQTKLSNIQQTSKDTFVLNIDQIILRLNIISYTSTQNFLIVKAADFTYTYKYDQIKDESMKQMVCGKFKIQYDEYLGHHKRYHSLIQTQKQAQLKDNQPDSQCQQFQDVINFFQLSTCPKFKVAIQPIQICINHQIIEKFSVFHFQKIQKDTYEIQNNILRQVDPDLIVKQSQFQRSNWINSQQINIPILQQKDHTKYISTGIRVIIPQQMAKQLYPCTQLVVNIDKIFGEIDEKYKRFDIGQIDVTCILPRQNIQSYEIMLNHGEVPFQTSKLIQPFSVTYEIQQKQVIKNINLIIKKNILLDVSSSKKLLKVIDLLYCFKPKEKDIRSIHKMRLRRKQSIGEEFIDACQNLNEHIVKSTISVMSQKQINPPRSNLVEYKQTKLSIFIQNISVILHYGQINLINFELQKYSYSLQKYNILSLNQKNLQIKIHSIKQVIQYFGQIQQKLKKYNLNNDELPQKSQNSQIQNIQVSQIQVQNFHARFLIFDKKQNFLYLNFPNIDLRASNINKTVTFQMGINYYQKNYQNHQIPLLENFRVQYKQKVDYNHISKSLQFSSITMDINPKVIKLLSKIYQIYQQPIQDSCQIKNNTVNQIKISINNRYLQQKHHQSCVVNERNANVILYGNKIELNFLEPRQQFQITQNVYLLRSQESMKRHVLQSNLRICNHQDKTIWVKIVDPKQQDELSIKRSSTIDFKYLSQAKSFEYLNSQSNTNVKSRGFPRKQSLNSIVESMKQTMNLPLKPKQQAQFLVSSQDKCISLLDQGILFTPVSIKRLLQQRQVLVQSENEEYLVLKCVKIIQSQQFCPIYVIKILSPIYIVNNLPWRVSYRLGKQALDIEQMINTQGRVIRKRSFQAVPLQKIQPLQNNKLRQILYSQLHDLQVSVEQYTGIFKISVLISNLLKVNNQKQSQNYFVQSSLICLSNGKRNLQLVLKIQMTVHTLKIKFYPEYVFVNMSNCDIYFKIKENEYTYPQTKLRTIKDQKKQAMQRQVQDQKEAFTKMYISLSNEKLSQRQILQQMFFDFKDRIQIFAGSITKKLPRYMLYESGLITSANLGGSSSGGYNSGYGSGSDGKQYEPKYTSTPLCHQGLIQYGHQKSYLFHRNIKIQQFFHLVVFVPTVHIINKSKSFFVAKSKVQNKLLKIQGLQMDFIAVNKEGLSLQAVQQNEQVNLNQWFNIDINRLGTIYYAKQLSSNGYESKEYVLRKKKLKKRPKIFYRIVLSQHDRGLQVLIEESQYPPISFINKTHFKLKVQEEGQGYEQQIGPDGMAEFACIKRPYIDPMFGLYVAHNYEYQFVQKFGVLQFKTIPCALDQRFIISIQQFKDKTIVIFGDERLMQMSQVKADFQIQKIQSFHIHVDQILISFMNDYYKEISCLKMSGIDYKIENKNQKKYLSMKIEDFQGYDYSSIQPRHTFYRVKNKNYRLKKSSLSQKVIQDESMIKKFFSANLVISFHKNATIVQKCRIRLSSSTIVFNSYLLLQTVKVYHNQILNFIKCMALNRPEGTKSSSKKKHSQQSLLNKQFIFESFVWQGTQLSLKCSNLHILCVFLDKSYYKWILQFIQWIGDFKPMNFGSAYINFENFTLAKFINLIDIKRKIKELGQNLIDYPLQQLNQIINTLLGFSDKGQKQKFLTLLKLGKSVQYVLNAFLNINQNFRTTNHHSYIERFKQIYESQKDILKKIQAFEFAQWKYFEDFPRTKLGESSISRFQRYNLKKKMITQCQNMSKIKLALDSSYNNKIYRQIIHIFDINENVLLGATEEDLVFYFNIKQEWIVVKHQHVISLSIQQRIIKKEQQQILSVYLAIASSYEGMRNGEYQKNELNQVKKSKMIHHQIRKSQISEQSLKVINKYIKSNKLINEY